MIPVISLWNCEFFYFHKLVIYLFITLYFMTYKNNRIVLPNAIIKLFQFIIVIVCKVQLKSLFLLNPFDLFFQVVFGSIIVREMS